MIAYDDTKVSPPRNLTQAMDALDRLLSPESIAQLRDGEVSPVELHLGLGMALRNNWGLWHRSALARWFRRRGIRHADSMSSFILTSYVRRLRGEPIDVEARLEEHERYMREAEMADAIERNSGPLRKGRVLDRLMGWRVDPRDVQTIALPEGTGEKRRIARFETYRGGVVVFDLDHRDHVPGEPWYRKVHYIAAPREPLRPLARRDCPEIHDLLTVGAVARWLCRDDGRWSLIHEDDDGVRREPLPITADNLRLGSAGEALLLLSDRTIYSKKGGAWVVDFSHPSPWFPVQASPPYWIGDALYFRVPRWTRTDFYGFDFSAPKPTVVELSEILVYPYYGYWSMSVADVVPSSDEGLWVSLGHRYYSALAHIDHAGEVSFSIFEGEVTPSLEYDEGLLSHRSLDGAALREQLPAVGLASDDESLYFAGDTGVAVAHEGLVEWLVRFSLPVASVEGEGASNGDPRHLALFGADAAGPAFLLGDRARLTVVYPRADGEFVAVSPPEGRLVTLGENVDTTLSSSPTPESPPS